MPKERLSPDVFRLPVERIRAGYYSDAYFNFTKELLEREDKHSHVVMQVFQKKHSVLGGIDEAIAVLKLCSDDWDGLEVHALFEGDEIEPHETVMTIEVTTAFSPTSRPSTWAAWRGARSSCATCARL